MAGWWFLNLVIAMREHGGSVVDLANPLRSLGRMGCRERRCKIGRWRGGETMMTAPLVTAEREATFENICVVQKVGTGGIAGGSKVVPSSSCI